jgi:DNA-binding transcriptional LysR family regulator
MDRFNSIRIFVKVAEQESFAAVARELNMAPSAVTRAVSLLEDHLGTRLLVRTTRSVRLTDSGQRFLNDGKRLLTDLAEAEAGALGAHASPQGELRVTAPALFGRIFVTPILGDFLDLHSQVSAQTLFADRVVNLMDEDIDVAIRIGDLPDSSLTATRCGAVRPVVFAAPGYTQEFGEPKHPKDLIRHKVIQSLAVGTSQDWAFQTNERVFTVPIEPRLKCNTNDAVIELALRGWGISRLLSYQIAPYRSAGELETVLREYELPPVPIHVMHQEGRRVSAKVRAFVDYLTQRLRADPSLQE